MPEDVSTNEPVKTETKGTPEYGKKSWAKWLLIYIVIGVLVYGLVYYFAYSKKGNNAQTDNTKQQNQEQSTPNEQSVEETVVTLTDKGFSPQSVTIKKGTQVTWKNGSGKLATINSAPHPAHTDFPLLNLGEFESGDSMSLVFDTAGTYKYHNHLNPSQFGSVVVE